MELTFPKPTNWQEFENVSLFVWREIWGDPAAQKNGRLGQPQAGVDIFGRTAYAPGWHGVQCKGKLGGFHAAFTDVEVEMELDKTISFEPKLAHLAFATTAARDEHIQQVVRAAPSRLGLKLAASIWSWDDLSLELSYRPTLVERLFPHHRHYLNDPLRIDIPRLDPRGRLGAGFTRPAVRAAIAHDRSAKLQQVIAEMVDNCFRYGEATSAIVDVRPNGVTVTDNGRRFDPRKRIGITRQSLESGCGMALLTAFVIEFSVTVTWEADPRFGRLDAIDRGNRVTLTWHDSRGSTLVAQQSEYTIADYAVCAREEAERVVAQIMKAYNGGHLHLRIDGISIVSGIAMLIRSLLEVLPSDASIFVYAPDEGYNRDFLTSCGPRVFFVRIPSNAF